MDLGKSNCEQYWTLPEKVVKMMKNLKPQRLWNYFFEIISIPRPSHNESAISEWLLNWAKERSFEEWKDDAGNVLVKVPASTGAETRPTVILQAHMDMVPQANANKNHNFLKDPIIPIIDPKDNDWIKADGTTLGADNGMGMAAALAIAEEDFVHGPLELVFTVNEEDGMSGASVFPADLLKGKYLLNLDGEDYDNLLIGSAGMLRSVAKTELQAVTELDGLLFHKINLSGFSGGHSGLDIHHRQSAIKSLVLLLQKLIDDGKQFYIAEMKGGNAVNAIPREAEVIIGFPESHADSAIMMMEKIFISMKGDFSGTDPDARLSVSEQSVPHLALSSGDSRHLISTLVSLPNGPLAMEPALQDTTMTSANLGILVLEEKNGVLELEVQTLIRSSVEEEMEATADELESKLAGLGAKSLRPVRAPAWKPEPENHLLSLAVEEFKKLFGKAPRVTSLHAGLECGVFREKYPSLEIVSFGATIRNPHSPDEKVSISGTAHFWEYLLALLGGIKC